MTNYKLVPVEPTWDMEEAGQYALEAGCYASGVYADMLADAPVVNIVATKNELGQIVSVTLQDEDHRIHKVIAEADVHRHPATPSYLEYPSFEESANFDPVPTVQEEPLAHTFYILHNATEGQKYIKKDIDDGCLQIFEREEDAQRAKRRHPGTDYKRVDYYTTPQPTEQLPAPDVSALVEALEGLLDVIDESRGVSGYHLNGEIAEWGEFQEVHDATAALATHRKGEEK